jgi:hypothetical protein
MPIEIRWHDEQKTAVYLEFAAPWTWDDLYGSIDTSKGMMSQSPADMVDILVLMKDGNLPKGSNSMHGMNAIRYPHLKLRYIIITQNTFIRTLMGISSKVNPKMAERYVIVPTLEEALRLNASREQLLKAD